MSARVKIYKKKGSEKEREDLSENMAEIVNEFFQVVNFSILVTGANFQREGKPVILDHVVQGLANALGRQVLQAPEEERELFLEMAHRALEGCTRENWDTFKADCVDLDEIKIN